MAYINIQTNQYPLSEQDIKLAHPLTSFGTLFVPPEGYSWVFPTPIPSYNSITQSYRESQPELTIQGNYEQRWEVISKFQEYTDEQGVIHTIAEQEAVAIQADQLAKTEAMVQQYDQALTSHIDSVAQQKRWADRVSCMARAGFPNVWQAQAIAFGTWAADCEVLAYQIQAEVVAGTRPLPSIEEFINLMPTMFWPT